MVKYIPSNYKYKKIHRKVYINKLVQFRSNYLKKNSCGLKIVTNGILTSTMIEEARNFIMKRIKKVGTLRVNIFSHFPITKKSNGIRMGKGVGDIDQWVSPVRSGLILFELTNIPFNTAKKILTSVSYKLPVKTKFIYLK